MSMMFKFRKTYKIALLVGDLPGNAKVGGDTNL